MKTRCKRKLVRPLKIKRRRRGFAKLLVLGTAVEFGRRLGPRRKKLWQRVFAKMPDDFPPKAMFLNVKAIREQNERIIKLLEEHEATETKRPLKTAS